MASEKIISFIICVNNESKYKRAESYIQNLNKHSHYIIEIIGIRGSSSMTKGYNLGMQCAKGRYKIYMHQDVWIINPFFINRIMDIFNSDSKIGIIGVIGAKKLPPNGIWWESKCQLGKVVDNHTGNFELIDHSVKYTPLPKDNSPIIPFEYAEVIDGLLIATQYDIHWREDLFNGWHFYDISQCLEFKKNHYDVVIPKQEEPWCIHDCGIVDLKDYELYREKFINEYM